MAKPEHEEGADNFDNVSQVIEALERECGISPDVSSKTILIKHTLVDPQTSMVTHLELLISQRTALRGWCLENTRITEIHTLKGKIVYRT